MHPVGVLHTGLALTTCVAAGGGGGGADEAGQRARVSAASSLQTVRSGDPTGAVGTIAGAKGDPTVWDKVDVDQAIDDYGEMYGVNPEIIVDDEKVAAMRAARAKAQQVAAAAATAPQAVESAKTLGDTNVENLRDVLGMYQGYNSPTSTEV